MRSKDSQHKNGKDETGKIFGRLTVLRRGDKVGDALGWICQCACGAPESLVSGPHLRSGNSRSCGCLNREAQIGLHVKLIDPGTRFGGVVIVGRAPGSKAGLRWHFKCDCGREGIAFGYYLRSGMKRSCGRWCTARDFSKARSAEMERTATDGPVLTFFRQLTESHPGHEAEVAAVLSLLMDSGISDEVFTARLRRTLTK